MAETEVKFFAKHTKIYTLGNLLNRGAGLILLPVYVNTLSPDEYGLYSFVAIAMDIVAVLLVMGMGTTLVKFYVQCTTAQDRNELVGTTFIFYGVSALIFLLLVYPLASLTCWIIFTNLDHQWLFTLGYIAMIFTALFNLQLQYLLVKKDSWSFMLTSVLKTLIFLGLNIYLVAYLKQGIEGILWGTLLSSVLLSTYLFVYIFREIKPVFSWDRLKQLLIFGAPLVPAVLCDTLLVSLDRFFLNRFVSTAAVGQYSLGDKLTNLIKMFVIVPFFQIWVVRRLENMHQINEGSEHNLNQIFLLFITFVTTASLGVALFAPEVVAMVAAPEYMPAATLVPVLALTQVVLAVKLNFELEIYHANKTQYMAYCSAITLAAAIPIFYLLISYLGLLGAVWSVFVVNLFRASLMGWFAKSINRKTSLKDFLQILIVVLLGVVFYMLAYFLFQLDITFVAVASKLILVALFPIAILISPLASDLIRREIVSLLLSGRWVPKRFRERNYV